MQKFTTGDVAKICGVSVRTVQYYDKCKIVSPTEISDGGRRLYSENDLNGLKKACFLKSLEIPLKTVKDIMNSDSSEEVIAAILKEQKICLEREIETKQKSVEEIDALLVKIKNKETGDFKNVMRDLKESASDRKKLKKVRLTMLLTAIPVGIIELGSILLWIFTGIWWPFAATYVPVGVIYGVLISKYYFKKVNYVCPHCEKVFKPKFNEALWAMHTPTTRKLVCPHCNEKSYCVETARETD